MAGRGPAPQETRRRRVAPARGDWRILPPLEKPVLPRLPARDDGKKWSKRARATWETWRKDPVTAMWSPSDVGYAIDTLELYDDMTARSSSEVRLRMDGLGLTPKGKRDLRWRLASAEPPPELDDPEPEQPRGPARSSSRRRARLSVVR